jgi:hypothetical protein
MGMIVRTNTPAELQRIIAEERSKLARFAPAVDRRP